MADRLRIERNVAAAIFDSHGLSVADLVSVARVDSHHHQRKLKIERAQCVQLYRRRRLEQLDCIGGACFSIVLQLRFLLSPVARC